MAEFFVTRDVYYVQQQFVVVEANSEDQAIARAEEDSADHVRVIDASEKKVDEIQVVETYNPQGAFQMICAEIDQIWEGLHYGGETALFNYRGGYYTGRQGAKDAWAKKLKVA
jgi:hypothetical protein